VLLVLNMPSNMPKQFLASARQLKTMLEAEANCRSYLILLYPSRDHASLAGGTRSRAPPSL
jgi:hypothetical protein